MFDNQIMICLASKASFNSTQALINADRFANNLGTDFQGERSWVKISLLVRHENPPVTVL